MFNLNVTPINGLAVVVPGKPLPGYVSPIEMPIVNPKPLPGFVTIDQ